MFFEFKVGPEGVHVNQEPPKAPDESELPEFIQGPEGELIINRKDSLISKTIDNSDIPLEEMQRSYLLTQMGWMPILQRYPYFVQPMNPTPAEPVTS
jgi:hypothetical protein